MSEGLMIAMLGVGGTLGVTGIGLLGSIWYRLGKINGTLANHDRVINQIVGACPLCPNKEVHHGPH